MKLLVSLIALFMCLECMVVGEAVLSNHELPVDTDGNLMITGEADVLV